MIAPLAITLALAFWAPYNGGEPVCPNGVQIVYEASALSDPSAPWTGWVDPQDMTARNCRFHLRVNVADQTVPYQCMIVAHELGHAAMGLPDTATDGDIMHGPMTIPSICIPAAPRKGLPGTLARSRNSMRHMRWVSRMVRSRLVLET